MATQVEVISPTEPSALVLVETLTPVQVFAPGFIDPLLDKIKSFARSEAAKLDISRDKDRKEIASLARKLASAKTRIDEKRKELVRDEKDRLKKIDAEGARIWDELEALQKEVRQPLTDWENAEKERVAGHEAAIAEIEAAGPYTLQNWQTLSLEDMRDRLDEIGKSNRDWQEFSNRAEYAIVASAAQIKDAIAKREKYDAEQAELKRLREEAAERERKEREERIAREAKERAEREAREREEKAAREAAAERERLEREATEREEAERQAKENAIRAKQQAELAAARAEEARLAAIEQAKKDAEAARLAAEKTAKEEAEAAVQRERERVEAEKRAEAAAQAKREADTKHKAKINREILNAFRKAGFDEETGKSIIAMIAKGEVPHVHITY